MFVRAVSFVCGWCREVGQAPKIDLMRSIFITGAAGGIGLATARKFLDEGWLVGAYDIADVPLEHPNLFTGRLDVTDSAQWEAALADFAERTDGGIDVVDNNAGIIASGPLAETDPDRVRSLVEVNAVGVTLGARAAHPYLAATRGTLINIASASAIFGQPSIAVYSATKSYVGTLTEALSLEWRGDGIRVVDVWPLWAKTSLADVDAASVRRLGVNITPEQVADTVFTAATATGRWNRGKLHYGVSALDKILYVAGKIAPDRLRRLVTRILAG